jgi:hypothetical protein
MAERVLAITHELGCHVLHTRRRAESPEPVCAACPIADSDRPTFRDIMAYDSASASVGESRCPQGVGETLHPARHCEERVRSHDEGSSARASNSQTCQARHASAAPSRWHETQTNPRGAPPHQGGQERGRRRTRAERGRGQGQEAHPATAVSGRQEGRENSLEEAFLVICPINHLNHAITPSSAMRRPGPGGHACRRNTHVLV